MNEYTYAITRIFLAAVLQANMFGPLNTCDLNEKAKESHNVCTTTPHGMLQNTGLTTSVQICLTALINLADPLCNMMDLTDDLTESLILGVIAFREKTYILPTRYFHGRYTKSIGR